MVLKHNFSELTNYNDPFTGILVVVNDATSGAFIYTFLLVVFVISAWSFINRTQDIGKSLLTSNHIITILTIILFYGGKVAGTTFISELFLYTVLVVESIGIGAMYLLRKNK